MFDANSDIPTMGHARSRPAKKYSVPVAFLPAARRTAPTTTRRLAKMTNASKKFSIGGPVHYEIRSFSDSNRRLLCPCLTRRRQHIRRSRFGQFISFRNQLDCRIISPLHLQHRSSSSQKAWMQNAESVIVTAHCSRRCEQLLRAKENHEL